jgi:hypothetical protein
MGHDLPQADTVDAPFTYEQTRRCAPCEFVPAGVRYQLSSRTPFLVADIDHYTSFR